MLPESLIKPLKEHLRRVETLHDADLQGGYGSVYLPDALDRKYPNASRLLAWQYVFPSSKLSIDPRSKRQQRHHVDESVLQRAVQEAIRRAGIHKAGSKNVETTMIYTHIVNKDARGIRSPLDD